VAAYIIHYQFSGSGIQRKVRTPYDIDHEFNKEVAPYADKRLKNYYTANEIENSIARLGLTRWYEQLLASQNEAIMKADSQAAANAAWLLEQLKSRMVEKQKTIDADLNNERSIRDRYLSEQTKRDANEQQLHEQLQLLCDSYSSERGLVPKWLESNPLIAGIAGICADVGAATARVVSGNGDVTDYMSDPYVIGKLTDVIAKACGNDQACYVRVLSSVFSGITTEALTELDRMTATNSPENSKNALKTAITVMTLTSPKSLTSVTRKIESAVIKISKESSGTAMKVLSVP
jgi:hypothetical protein